MSLNERHISPSRVAAKTLEEAYAPIEYPLTDATAVAQMRQVLVQPLQVIGAALVCLARQLED